MIQIGWNGLTTDPEEIAALRREFREGHCARLPQLLAPALLDFVGPRLERARWQTTVHPVGEEYTTDDLPSLSLLDFAANLREFRELIEDVTGCTPLRRFQGRIYRMVATAGHRDDWHDDNIHARLVGMSLNLSRNVFRGGLFQLRERASGRILAQVANLGFGDALIFRISRDLKHRVSDLEGDEPKTAFAGWFVSDLPDFFEELRTNSRKSVAPQADK